MDTINFRSQTRGYLTGAWKVSLTERPPQWITRRWALIDGAFQCVTHKLAAGEGQIIIRAVNGIGGNFGVMTQEQFDREFVKA